MASKILPIQKTEKADYSNEPLADFWNINVETIINDGQIAKQKIISLLSSVSEGFICIQSVSLDEKNIIKQIYDTANNREVRIYILVNEYSSALDSLNSDCLIRYKLQNTGSFILINPNSNQSDGLFFSGDLSGNALSNSEHILKELSKDQINNLFRHFCFQFWETAKEEVIEKGNHSKIKSKPFDVFHDPSEFGNKNFIYSTLFDFVEKARRGDFSKKFIVPLNKENESPIYIIQSAEKNLGVNKMIKLYPQEEFEKKKPDLVDDGKSCSIEYHWINEPFYLPQNCTLSSLYKDWENEKIKINNYIQTIINKIQEAEKKENIISSTLTRFFLGKKTSFSQLKDKLEELMNIDFANIEEDVLKEKINQINSIYYQVENDIQEIDLENKNAKLDEEIKNLIDEKKKKEKELENKKNLKESAKNSEQTDNQNQKILLNKLNSEIDKIQKEINRIDDEIKRKEKEKSKLTTNRENNSSLSEFFSIESSKSNINTGKILQIPKLPQLPQIGKLYQSGNQLYLAIEFWEEYEQGKKEANRLNAKLCAIKN
jgi:hypothetical protein